MKRQDELRDGWRREQLDACEEIAAGFSPEALVSMGVRALELCLQVTDGPRAVHEVVRVGRDRTRWGDGHRAFDAVRKLTLRAEPVIWPCSQAKVRLLFVAENTARVIYNATAPIDPFDDDSAAWLLKTLAEFALASGSSSLPDAIWRAIVDSSDVP